MIEQAYYNDRLLKIVDSVGLKRSRTGFDDEEFIGVCEVVGTRKIAFLLSFRPPSFI